MYKEYHRYWYMMILAKRDLENFQGRYDQILDDITKTTVSLKQNISERKGSSNKLGNLIAKKIDLESIIKAQTLLYQSRLEKVKVKYEELKSSKDSSDIIYRMKFILKFKVKEIARTVGYVEGYTYDLIAKIRKEIQAIETDEIKKKNKK